jgi:hypothetical protein
MQGVRVMTATTAAPEHKLIAARVYDPHEPSFFGKSKANERAEYITIECANSDCPLLKMGQCVMTGILGPKCPYGFKRHEQGPTKRAAKFWEFVSDKKKLAKEVGWNVSYAADKIAFIGDYIYLPYSFANGHNSPLPFLQKGGFMVSGSDFIKREDWTLDFVLKFIAYRPHAMFGGEITDFQTKSVPKFLAHLREVDPDMWQQLIAVRPEYDTTPNYVGRKALIRTLASPLTIRVVKHVSYPVDWEWNGKTLKTKSVHAYGSTWGGMEAKAIELELEPQANASVVVADNSWVTADTVFVD